MKYYIKQLTNHTQLDLNNLHKKVEDHKYILADDGLYCLHEKQLYQYKLIDNQYNIIKNYINNFTLIYSHIYWKKNKKSYKIPYNSHIIHIS